MGCVPEPCGFSVEARDIVSSGRYTMKIENLTFYFHGKNDEIQLSEASIIIPPAGEVAILIFCNIKEQWTFLGRNGAE